MQYSLQQSPDALLPAVVVGAIILFNLVVIGLVWLFNYRKMQTIREAWQQLSMRTGLSYQPGNFWTPPGLSGDFRRRQLVLDTYVRQAGRSRIRYTRVTLALRMAVDGSLHLGAQGFLAGVGRALGVQDIPVGSERFDKTFVVRGKPPELAQTAFGDPMLQDSLIRLRERASFNLELSANSLIYTQRGLRDDNDYLAEVFNTLSDLADKLDGGSKSSMF